MFYSIIFYKIIWITGLVLGELHDWSSVWGFHELLTVVCWNLVPFFPTELVELGQVCFDHRTCVQNYWSLSLCVFANWKLALHVAWSKGFFLTEWPFSSSLSGKWRSFQHHQRKNGFASFHTAYVNIWFQLYCEMRSEFAQLKCELAQHCSVLHETVQVLDGGRALFEWWIISHDPLLSVPSSKNT